MNGQMRRIIESGIACGDKVEIFTFARAVALDFIFGNLCEFVHSK